MTKVPISDQLADEATMNIAVTLKCFEGAFHCAKPRIGNLRVLTLLRQFADKLTLGFNERFGFVNMTLSLSQVL